MQNTLQSDIYFKGIGLHSGQDISLSIRPAETDAGIIFVRTDIRNKDNTIPALWNNVVDTRLCTVIGNKDGVVVGTVEHLMAALRGCHIDNAIIELDGPEVPVMDGSSAEFVKSIDAAGIQTQNASGYAIRVLKDVSVTDGDKVVSLSPANGYIFGGCIDYDHPEIGSQCYETQLVNGNFRHDLANCRTFGLLKDVEAMWSAGLAKGGSLDNAIVLDDEKVINPEGLRFNDEFIRHKILDAIGDLYLAGAPIMGAYKGMRAGHALNNQLLHALFADKDAWEKIVVSPTIHNPQSRSQTLETVNA